MSLQRDQRGVIPAKKSQSEDVILFDVGEMRFAIAARDVDEIRNMDGMTDRPLGADRRVAKVKSTLSRTKGSAVQTFYVVDSSAHFHVKSASPTRLLVLRDHPVAVLADAIDRMRQISMLHALPRAYQGTERNWYRGLAVLDGRVIPMVEPGSFLTAEDLEILAAKKVQAVTA